MVKLVFAERSFHEDKSEGGAYLELDESAEKAILSYSPDAGLIVKRTAQRQALGICKTGFLLKTGKRIGVSYTLEIQESGSIDDRLLQQGYHYR